MDDNVEEFDQVKSQFKVLVDRLNARGVIGVVLNEDDTISPAFSGNLLTSDACEMICHLVQFVLKDTLDEEI